MRHAMGICAAVTAAALLLAGCGGKAADSGAVAAAAGGQDLDPCSLMTATEITAITTDVVIRADRDGATCNYRSDPKDGTQVTVYATGGAKQMETARAGAHILGGMGAAVADKGGAGADVNHLLQPDKSATPALGDEAMWEINDTLAVRKGDAFVEVSPPIMHDPATHTGYPLVKPDEKRAIATAIAKKLLEKLAR